MTATRTSAPIAAHTTAPAITATGLRKSYGDKLVLDGIDLSSPRSACSPCSPWH
ncbi:hypothetical protein GCM10010320_59550 [Streptomyces caelestis]|jgi:ABC-2 type transport system ATP-binding protein|uniref:ABC-2 type transport system ATP-binding protein n=1 Tax=Streptomyces caelestis TaxID=36816 RepID=A0A7W9GYY5_9ACTN|nr:ABC-2 type transport system ATP-binding protein [Streptomyces caelestis]GGW70275.1 hypothetical protein GCM10010320_59550 [Streptomyces caelestis]